MPKGYPPSVFVSSTCYDLNQVRADMKRFLESMGLDPILSEMPAFPVSPQTSPVENCIKAVKERADIFVLIVGARYGSQNESGKSVTNLEYLEAKAKRIPIYVFVLKQILNVLPIWKKNPQADYEGTVDTPKLFEFVETLRNAQDHWVFDFDEAQHIMDILRRQLAYLFMDGLILRDKLKDLKLSPVLTELTGKSLKFLWEKPIGWEFRLFASVLADELNADQKLKWDLSYGLKMGKIHDLGELPQMMQWVQQKLKDIQGLVHSSDRLMNKAFQEAMKEQGVSGDPEHIVYVARKIAQVRRELLVWTIDFNCTEVKPECERLISLISTSSQNVLEQLESIPKLFDEETDKAVAAHERGEKYAAHVQLTFTIPNSDEICAEFERVNQLIATQFGF
jgi:hypothetical protein